MSRREYKIDESNLPDGCILYAPLTESDITDHISGNSFVPFGIDSMAWNNSMQAWRFHKTTNQSIDNSGYFAKCMLSQQYSISNLSILVESYFVTASYYSGFGDYPYYICIDMLPTRYGITQPGILSTWNKSAQTVGDGYSQIRYLNGSQVFSAIGSNSLLTFNSIRIGVTTSVCLLNDFYIKNLLVFNRKLELSEIRQIQGL